MASNWENFLKNLGEWQGSFTQVSPAGELLDSTPSIVNLDGLDHNQRVRFRLRRFAQGYAEPPTQDYTQEYSSIGRQNIFFDTGAFSKGSLQLAPFAEFGAEYGFVGQNRRLRFVQLFDQQGKLAHLVLIREFRQGTEAKERPPLTIAQLLGDWEGEAHTCYADWQPPEIQPTRLQVWGVEDGYLEQKLTFGETTLTSRARIEGQRLWFEDGPIPRQILLLPDGVSCLTPMEVKLRQPFFLEVGWLLAEDHRQRLIRSYNEKGEWVSATLVTERRITQG
uniref:Uncharacterized protein n=1 Tax=Cyanothece sp. (strain PCC 7425 / ATCC 29141) TaxID=395961 RepID=B8HWG0_CYAP4